MDKPVNDFESGTYNSIPMLTDILGGITRIDNDLAGVNEATEGDNIVGSTNQRSIKATRSKVAIAKCPNGDGKVKSPLCCGQDMTCPV